MERQFFEMCNELVDVDSYEDVGYKNCIDISVDNSSRCFILANGLISHNSALGGLLPSLGRDGKAYYMLKGKPLNAYSSTQQKFLANKELSSLYQIIKNGVTFEDRPDGEWYELTINGETMTANINDEVKIDNKWVAVADLVND